MSDVSDEADVLCIKLDSCALLFAGIKINGQPLEVPLELVMM